LKLSNGQKVVCGGGPLRYWIENVGAIAYRYSLLGLFVTIPS